MRLPTEVRATYGQTRFVRNFYSPVDGSNAPVQIRFTVTGVALREDAGARWLAMDYVANVDTNWVTVFRAESSGFDTEFRSTRLLEGRAGVQAVRHERAEMKLPADYAEADAAVLRDDLAEALVAQPLEVPAGHEIHLFKLPVANLGLLSAMLGARPAHLTPSVRLTFTAIELEPSSAGQRLVLEYQREDHSADITILASGRFPGETVNLVGATLVDGGEPGRPLRERHRIEFDLAKTLASSDAQALRQRLAEKWLGQPLVVLPGDQHTLFTVPSESGTPVRVAVLGRLPDISRRSGD